MKTAFSQQNKSKHAKKHNKLNKSKVVILILLIIVLICVAFYISSFVMEKNKNKSAVEGDIDWFNSIASTLPANEANEVAEDNEEITMIEDDDQATDSTEKAKNPAYEDDFPSSIGGYKVIGQIVIDKVGIKRSILSKTTNKSLKLAPTWFDGPALNTVGNTTITGHNNSTQFKGLYKLNEGDTFYVIDKATGSKVTYKIYDIFTVMPEDTDYVLSQKTNGKREITLVTCNPGGLTRRIFKAREV